MNDYDQSPFEQETQIRSKWDGHRTEPDDVFSAGVVVLSIVLFALVAVWIAMS